MRMRVSFDQFGGNKVTQEKLNRIIAAQNTLRHAWEYLQYSVRNIEGVKPILEAAYDQLRQAYDDCIQS